MQVSLEVEEGERERKGIEASGSLCEVYRILQFRAREGGELRIGGERIEEFEEFTDSLCVSPLTLFPPCTL